MVYKDYLKRIRNEGKTEGLVINLCGGGINPRYIPLRVERLEDRTLSFVVFPKTSTDNRGREKSVVSFKDDAFKGNVTITDVALNSNVTHIPEEGFMGCRNLECITIPKTIHKIYKDTFKGCNSLTDVYYEGTEEEWKRIRIVSSERIIQFGSCIPGTPVRELVSDRSVHLDGNDSLLRATIHFGCVFDF